MALITHLLGAFAFMPDAGRVAPIRGRVVWDCVVVAFGGAHKRNHKRGRRVPRRA